MYNLKWADFHDSPVLNSIMSRPPVLNLPKSENEHGKSKQKFTYAPQQSMTFNKNNFHEIFGLIKFCGHLLFQILSESKQKYGNYGQNLTYPHN